MKKIVRKIVLLSAIICATAQNAQAHGCRDNFYGWYFFGIFSGYATLSLPSWLTTLTMASNDCSTIEVLRNDAYAYSLSGKNPAMMSDLLRQTIDEALKLDTKETEDSIVDQLMRIQFQAAPAQK